MQIDVQSDHKSFKLQMAFLMYLLEIIVKWKPTIIITAIIIITMDWTIYIVCIIYAMVMVLHLYSTFSIQMHFTTLQHASDCAACLYRHDYYK